MAGPSVRATRDIGASKYTAQRSAQAMPLTARVISTCRIAARLASYRDGLLLAIKASGKDHWERHLTGDEMVHILDGTASLEIVCDDWPPKSFVLRAGMIAVIPQGAWHRFHSSDGVTLMTATPAHSEVIEFDVDDPRRVERKPA